MAVRPIWLSSLGTWQPDIYANQKWLPGRRKKDCLPKLAASKNWLPVKNGYKSKKGNTEIAVKIACQKKWIPAKNGCQPKATTSQMPMQAKSCCQHYYPLYYPLLYFWYQQFFICVSGNLIDNLNLSLCYVYPNQLVSFSQLLTGFYFILIHQSSGNLLWHSSFPIQHGDCTLLFKLWIRNKLRNGYAYFLYSSGHIKI